MKNTFRNLLKNPYLAILFMIPGKGETLRVTGKSTIVRDKALRESMAVKNRIPNFAVVVHVERALIHCPNCVARAKLWQPEAWPDSSGTASGFPPMAGCDFKLWMERFVLTDAQWAKMEPHCLGKPTDPGRSGSDNRRFVEAVLWIARTGSPWRGDLPLFFGNWNSVFKRYRDWVKAGVFIRLFEACSDEPDMEYAMVDATIVKVHRHGQGAKGGRRTRRSAAPRAA